MTASSEQTRLRLGTADHLQDDLALARVSPLRLEILKEPAWSFDGQHANVGEPGFDQVGLQLLRMMQERGREILALQATVLSATEVLPGNRCIARIVEQVAGHANRANANWR